MQAELEHKYTLRIGRETFEANPAGNFRLKVERTGYYYRKVLDGEMTFTGDDFDRIYIEAEECQKIIIEIDFKGVPWYGIFTKTDCDIHVDKGYIKVTPEPYDYYHFVLPYLNTKINIMPPMNGFKSDVVADSVRWYKKERLTVTIDEPYTGPNAQFWNGYSVNDWIGGSYGVRGYSGDNGWNNSLPWYLTKRKGHSVSYRPGAFRPWEHKNAADTLNVLTWLDYEGYVKGIGTPTEYGFYEFARAMHTVKRNMPEEYTLVRVDNYYSDEGEWQHCDLTYEREVWDGRGLPPSGDIYSYHEYLWLAIKARSTSPQESAEDFYGRVAPVMKDESWGWLYHPDDDKWVRRPMAIGSKANQVPEGQSDTAANLIKHFGDGTWFTPLIERKTPQGWLRYQILLDNPWFEHMADLYGMMTIDRRFHRIISILGKMASTIWVPKDLAEDLPEEQGEQVYEEGDYESSPESEPIDYEEGPGDDDYEDDPYGPDPIHELMPFPSFQRDHVRLQVRSRYFTSHFSPLPQLEGVNDWAYTLVCQNSDVKRPYSTEKATKQEYTIKDFLDMICAISNAGWAVYNGRLVVEHAMFFESGFRYPSAGIVPVHVINPQSIYNPAKDMNFMSLSRQFRYHREMMQKYEVYKLAGGQEPFFNNSMITYTSPCVNNYPEQNKRDVQILGLSLDVDFISGIGEGDDEGITLIRAVPKGDHEGEVDVYHYDIPYEQDPDGKWRINGQFNLEYILTAYHFYGRSFKQGFINGNEYDFITRPVVLQDVMFPYREDLYPYSRVLTELGYGIILDGMFHAKTAALHLTLGFTEGVVDGLDLPDFLPPQRSQPTMIMYFHRHVQEEPSSRWYIHHNFGTDAIFRPVVYRGVDENTPEDMREIDYDYLKLTSLHTLLMGFTEPVAGEAYFLSFEVFDNQRHIGLGSHWEIPHELGTTNVATSIVWSSNYELRPDDIEIVSAAQVDLKFSSSVRGSVYVANLGTSAYDDFIADLETDVDIESPMEIVTTNVDGTLATVSRPRRYPLKPIILRANKEIGYNVSHLESMLLSIGFTSDVIANIIVIHHD